KPKLIALLGPLKGETFEIGGHPLSIGREQSCDLFLNEPLVSRRHCSVRLVDSQVRIADSGSMNGTYVNGVVVQEKQLQHGDRLRIGQSQFVYLQHEDDSEVVFAGNEEDHFLTQLTLKLEDVNGTSYFRSERIDGISSGGDRLMRD